LLLLLLCVLILLVAGLEGYDKGGVDGLVVTGGHEVDGVVGDALYVLGGEAAEGVQDAVRPRGDAALAAGVIGVGAHVILVSGAEAQRWL